MSSMLKSAIGTGSIWDVIVLQRFIDVSVTTPESDKKLTWPESKAHPS